MTTKLIQKQLFKGTQTFEIIDDIVHVHTKTMFNEEKHTVTLSVLDPEPVIDKSSLNFVSRVNGEPLVSFYLAKPNAEEFNAFINTLKHKVQEEYNTFTGFNAAIQAAGLGNNPVGDKVPGDKVLGDNVFEEPPEFDDSDKADVSEIMAKIDVNQIDGAIQMLKQYVDANEIKDFLTALEQLKADPKSEANLVQVAKAFNHLGPKQGAVLTYAPFINSLLSDNPFGKL